MKKNRNNLAEEKLRNICAKGNIAGPADNRAISQAQSQLDVIFPEEYVSFLKEYGAALVNGAEIYGIVDPSANDPPLWTHITEITKQLREERQYGTEDYAFIPFSDDGTGIYFYLNTRSSPATEIWAIGSGINRCVSSSLYEFIDQVASGRIAL